MRVFSFIRYAVAAYGLTLEALYPFDFTFLNSLPITEPVKEFLISDDVKESLKSQAHFVNYWSALVSLSFLAIFFYLLLVIGAVHGSIRLLMRLRPAFREKVQKRMAERALERQAKEAEGKVKPRPSKKQIWSRVFFSTLFSTAMVVNDAIFNRPEDAASFKDGVLERFQYLWGDARSIIRVQVMVLSAIIALAMVFHGVRRFVKAVRRRRAGVVADVESAPVPADEMVQVEEQKGMVIEEKLIDFQDGMDGIYEKMESYAVPADEKAGNKDEPLIRL